MPPSNLVPFNIEEVNDPNRNGTIVHRNDSVIPSDRDLRYPYSVLCRLYFPRSICNDHEIVMDVMRIFLQVSGNHVHTLNGLDLWSMYHMMCDFVHYGQIVDTVCMVANVYLVYTLIGAMVAHARLDMRELGISREREAILSGSLMRRYMNAFKRFMLYRWGIDKRHLAAIVHNADSVLENPDDVFNLWHPDERLFSAQPSAEDEQIAVSCWALMGYPVLQRRYPVPLMSFPGDSVNNPIEIREPPTPPPSAGGVNDGPDNDDGLAHIPALRI